MKRGIITIGEGGKVHIPTTTVGMSACEIASLFGILSGKVNAQIKTIFMEGLLSETEAVRTIRSEQGFFDLYSMEMIAMLSFRIAMPQAKFFCRRMIEKLTAKKKTALSLIVCYGKDTWSN